VEVEARRAVLVEGGLAAKMIEEIKEATTQLHLLLLLAALQQAPLQSKRRRRRMRMESSRRRPGVSGEET